MDRIENITELPNEILWEIFGYLSTKDVLRNVAQVSRKFHKLTQDQFLIRKIEVDTKSWHKLTEQQQEKYCNDILEVCKRSQKLTFFSLDLAILTDRYSMIMNALKYLRQCPRLKILKLNFRGFGFLHFLDFAFEHENLRELHLNCWTMEKSSFKKSLERILGNFPKLQYLYVSSDWIYGVWSEYCEISQKIASERNVKIEIHKS